MAALTALLPASVDGLSPMLQAVGADLHVRPGHVAAAMSAFVLAFAGAQLFAGMLGDALGRRPVILSGLILYLAASLLGASATSFPMFIASCALQGLGCAAVVLLARTIVRDLLERVAAARALALMGALYGPVPILAPLISGGLVTILGWRAPLLAMAALAAIVLVMALRTLPETLKPELRLPFAPGRVARTFMGLARSRALLAFIVGNAFSYSGLFLFASAAPQVIVTGMGNSAGQYAMMLALSTMGFIGGNIASRRIVQRFSIEGTLRIGTLFLIGGGALMITATLAAPQAWEALIIPELVYTVGWGMVQPQMQAGALSLHPRAIGQASALLGFAQLSMAGTIVAIFSRLTDGSPIALSLGVACCGTAAAMAWLVIWRMRHRQAG